MIISLGEATFGDTSRWFDVSHVFHDWMIDFSSYDEMQFVKQIL